MPRGRTQYPTLDLFSEASAPEPLPTPASQVSSPTAAVDMAASLRRYLLPKDLPNALKRLDDVELASLLVAALDEAKRRGKLPSGLAASAREDPAPCRSGAIAVYRTVSVSCGAQDSTCPAPVHNDRTDKKAPSNRQNLALMVFLAAMPARLADAASLEEV